MGDEFGDFDEPGFPGDPGDAIPCRGSHRSVPLHDGQSAGRLRQVKRDIDKAFELSDVDELFAFAADVKRSPESRIFAAAKLQAMFEAAAEKRWERPRFDRDRLKVMVVGLDSKIWRDPHFYGTILDVRTRHGVPRERSLGPDE